MVAADDRIDGVSTAVSGELNIGVDGGPPTQGFAVGIDSIKGSVDPVALEGRAPNGSNELMIGSTTMERLGIGLGDEVELSGPGGSEDMVVVGRAIIPVIGSDTPDEGVILPLDTFIGLGGTETVADVDVNAVVLATAVDQADVGAIRDDIEAEGAVIDGPFRQASVTVLDEIRGIPLYVRDLHRDHRRACGVPHPVRHVPPATQRPRIIRTLGYRPRQAGGIIHWQGFFVAVAALVIGVPIGLIGGRLLWQSIAERTNVLSVIVTPWISIGILAVVAVIGATFVPRGRPCVVSAPPPSTRPTCGQSEADGVDGDAGTPRVQKVTPLSPMDENESTGTDGCRRRTRRSRRRASVASGASTDAQAELRPAWCFLAAPVAVGLAVVGLVVAAGDDGPTPTQVVGAVLVALVGSAGVALGVRRRHDRLGPIVLAGAVCGGVLCLAQSLDAHAEFDGSTNDLAAMAVRVHGVPAPGVRAAHVRRAARWPARDAGPAPRRGRRLRGRRSRLARACAPTSTRSRSGRSSRCGSPRSASGCYATYLRYQRGRALSNGAGSSGSVGG